MCIVDEAAGRAIEQIQTVRRAHPKVADLILEKCPNVVVAQRGLALRIVTEHPYHPAVSIHEVETAIVGCDPQAAGPILEHTGNLIAAERVRISRRVAKVIERAALALPSVQTRLGTDPNGSG